MKKNKRLIAILISLLIILSGTLSIAASYGTGGEALNKIKEKGADAVSNVVNTGYSDLISRKDLYCVMHNTSLRGTKTFNIAQYIKITGNSAENSKGKKIESKENGKLAYILNQKEGYGTRENYSTTQKALYAVSSDWTDAVGSELSFNMKYDKNKGYTEKALVEKATNYANNIGEEAKPATDNTDKNNISVTGYTKDNVGYIRVGPFNWSFEGKLTKVKVYGDEDKKIDDVTFSKFEGNDEKEISCSEIKSDHNFYITIRSDAGFTKIGKISATTSVSSEGTVYTAEMWLLKHSKAQNLILVKTDTENINTSIDSDFKYNIKLTKNIGIEKVDSRDQNIKLDNVGFIFKNKEKNQYIQKNGDGYSYVDSEDLATEFITDVNGKIELKDVIVGTYIAYEKTNSHYGYKAITEGLEIGVNQNSIIVPNEQIYVKLSGYVWKDMFTGKTNVLNSYYRFDENDNQDISVDNMVVRLKDINGNEINNTVTQERNIYNEVNGGEYIFEDVLIDQLANYFIEFEYNGLIYQSVNLGDFNATNSSKATDITERTILDKDFESVNSTGSNVANVKGKYNITYNPTEKNATSIKDSNCILHANTKDSGYNIKNYWKAAQTEIKYINLGIYEKAQTDLRLEQDLQNAQVGVNGYWHVYNYHNDTVNEQNPNNEWNVGVQFQTRKGGYNRAIYKSDIEYKNEQDKSKELQLYLTYKIAVVNESSYLMKVNNILEYYNNYYTLVEAGRGLDANKNITDNLSYTGEEKYNDNYKKSIINTDLTIEAKKANYIYVKFKVSPEGLVKLMNSKKIEVYNTAEINSYTAFKDNQGNTVAVVDTDSVPGNAIPGNVNTYEDDTEGAPNLTLELKGTREIEGTVFIDNEKQGLRIRQGNGIFDDGEGTLEGVKVTLHEINNSIEDKITQTDANGNFKFSEYIPGQYVITYTWGNKTYTVQNYKSTVYDSTRNQNDKYWYKDDVERRRTDAIDNYGERINIDSQISAITDNTVNSKIEEAYEEGYTGNIINSMNSNTPIMEMRVEYDSTYTDGNEDRVEFIVKNVDFGIIERAKQQLDMTKRVKNFKVILANGQVLVDATIDENGQLQGSHDHVTYMGPSMSNGIKDNGFIKLEIDSELIQGGTLEIGYEIKAINNSELDYMSEEYYKYGIQKGNLVTLKPSAVIDYLDKNLGFNAEKNTDWKQITVDELKNSNAVKVGDTEYLNAKSILYTEKTATALKPGETSQVELNVSKLLSTSNDLTFNNDAETVKVEKPVEKHVGSVIKYFPTDEAEDVQITPSTGDDKSYIIPIIVGISSLIILGLGTFIIKRKIIDKK